MGQALAKVEPFPGFPTAAGRRLSHFQYLAESIVYQQLAGKAAESICSRARRLTPGRGFPRPSECLELSESDFRGAGLSKAKTKAIRDLAEKSLDGTVNLRTLSRRADDEIVKELTQVWGIGEWTAQMFMMFRLGRLDVLPVGDLAVQEGMKILDQLDTRPKPAELRERGEIWQPLRSVATWVLYRLCELP